MSRPGPNSSVKRVLVGPPRLAASELTGSFVSADQDKYMRLKLTQIPAVEKDSRAVEEKAELRRPRICCIWSKWPTPRATLDSW